jgi:hypothetical protein
VSHSKLSMTIYLFELFFSRTGSFQKKVKSKNLHKLFINLMIFL